MIKNNTLRIKYNLIIIFNFSAREFRIGYGDIRARNIIRLTANTALIHGQFNQATLENDLAIISLRNGQTFNENIAKVVPIARYSPPMSREGFVASFGFTSNNLKTISERLMVARQIIIPNADCSKVFGRPVHRNQFCAQDQPPQPPADEPIEDEDEEEDQDEDDESPDSGGDADDSADDGLDPGLPGFDWGNFGRAITPRREEVVLTGVCRGDTGSAVVFQVDERYVAYGLVSRVPRGCNNNQPALYTDLTSFTQWIEDATLGAATILRV